MNISTLLNVLFSFDWSCLVLVGRDEVTKLKFEAKTFHIYANQKEVGSMKCIIKMGSFLLWNYTVKFM